MSKTIHPDILAEILAHCDKHSLSKSAFGEAAVGDPRFVFDVEAGRELRRKTIGRVRHYMETGVTHQQMRGQAA